MEHLRLFWKIPKNVFKLSRNFVDCRRVNLLASQSSERNYSQVLLLSKGSEPCGSLLHTFPNTTAKLHRYFSDESKPEKLKLMDFRVLVWPSLLKTIKNWIYTNFIIRPYLDADFSMPKFMEGARMATELVSHKLASGELKELDGLVSTDCLDEVKRNMATLNTKQRHALSIRKDDIYFSFPYELGILFDEAKINDANQQRFVEITVVHHVLRGHKEMVERGEQVPLNVGVHPDFRDNIFVLNYRFIRNYTKGVSDQWTINVINHFKPSDFV